MHSIPRSMRLTTITRGIHPMGGMKQKSSPFTFQRKIWDFKGETNVFANLGGRKCEIFIGGQNIQCKNIFIISISEGEIEQERGKIGRYNRKFKPGEANNLKQWSMTKKNVYRHARFILRIHCRWLMKHNIETLNVVIFLNVKPSSRQLICMQLEQLQVWTTITRDTPCNINAVSAAVQQ